MKLTNSKIIPFFLFIVALITRTFWINQIPNGITNDELHFALNAKAVYYGFTDMSGIWNPLSLTTVPDNPSAELTFPILAPLLGPVSLSLFSVKLPFVLISSLLVVLIYLIALEVNPTVGLISGLVAIINPWFFFTGRLGFDPSLAIFFLTLSFYSVLKLKGRLILFSLIPLLLGFYTYIATKVVFFPFVLFSIIFIWLKNHRRYTLYYVIVLSVCLIAVSHYAYTTVTSTSRLGELITPFSSQITTFVETERRLSSPSPFSRFFINRLTIYSYHLFKKYLNNFSPDVFFNIGDSTYLISLWKHGYFYYLDTPFLILGLYYLFRHHRRYFIIFISIILLSPIPEAVRSDTIPAYAFHSSLQYPFLLIILATGIYAFLSRFPRLKIIVFFFYLISFSNLLYLYFFRYPIYQPDGFNFTSRILSEYLKREKQDGKSITVITTEPSSLFRQYLFYSQKYTKQNFDLIKSLYQKNRFDLTFDNIRFTNQKPVSVDDQNMIYITQSSFYRPSYPSRQIKQIISGQEIFSIYNSNLCPNIKRNSQELYYLTDFQLEKYKTVDFCQKFISSD